MEKRKKKKEGRKGWIKEGVRARNMSTERREDSYRRGERKIGRGGARGEGDKTKRRKESNSASMKSDKT